MADQAVKVYFSNPDLLFAGEHPAPRLGQGGFAAALKTLVTEVSTLCTQSVGLFALYMSASAILTLADDWFLYV